MHSSFVAFLALLPVLLLSAFIGQRTKPIRLIDKNTATGISHFSANGEPIANCEAEQLVVIYSESGPIESYAMTGVADDHLVIAGTAGDKIFLTEVMPNGNVLWSISMDVLPGKEETITRIKTDEEGHLICIGRNTSSLEDWFVMRINSQTRDVMWVNKFVEFGDFIVRDFMDPGIGRPFVISGSERNSPAPGFSTDMFVRGLNRTNGEMVFEPFNNLNIGSAEDGVSIIADGDDYYVVGRYTRTGGFNDIRMGISRLDFEGKEVWSRMLHVPLDQTARLYGRDIAMKNGELYFIGSGDPDGTSSTSTLSYFGKMTTDGDLVFLREYDISGFIGQSFTSLVPTSDGFLISCYQREGNHQRGIIRVDNNGNPITTINYGEGLEIQDPYSELDFVVERELQTFVIKNSRKYTTESVIELISFNLENLITGSDSCTGFQPLPHGITLVSNPANVNIDLIEYSTPTTWSVDTISGSEFPLTDSIVCACIELCDNGIDDDMDGLIDCDDPDIQDSCCCIDLLPPVIIGDTEICEGDSSVISIDPGNFSILWSTGDTGSQIFVSAGGNYSVEIIDSCGNLASTSFVVDEYAITYGSIDTVLTDTTPIIINGTPYGQPGDFEQILVNMAGCDSILNINIENLNPELCDNGIDDDLDGLIDCADPELFDSCCCLNILPMDLGPDQTIAEGDTAFIFINEGYEGADWSTGEGGLFIAVTDEGWYWAEEEVCDSLVRDSVYVTVLPFVDTCAAEIFIPNVFTPNGDGVNDHLEVSFPEGPFDLIVFRVFDRWGGVVFETKDPYFKWDGRSGDKVLNPGVYVYMVEVICLEENQVISGDVTIIH